MNFTEKKNNTPNNQFFLSPLTVLVFISLLVLFCLFIGLAATMAFAKINGFDMVEAIANIEINNSVSLRNNIRLSLLINHLSMFVLPGFLFGFILYRQAKTRYFQLYKMPSIQNILLGIFLILCSFPLAQLAMWLNLHIPLPESLKSIEDTTTNLVNGLLKTEASYELFFNIFVVALIPAVGEEMIFRGVLQRQLARLFKHPIAGIWAAAIIFSAFHLQFEGFLPRMLLGALLGYLLYWTENLWVPIIAHFFYNAAQIVAQYFYTDKFAEIDLEKTGQVSWIAAIFSLFLVIYISYNIIQHNKKENTA